jgi:RNA polymerase sigma factor (sigma-70 family)
MLGTKLSGLSDSELILIFQDTQNPDVLAELCDPYIAWAQKTLAWRCKKYYWLTEEDIEDIYSDFWVRVIKNLPEFDCSRRGSFRGWLSRILGSALIDYLRKDNAYLRNLSSVSIDEEDGVQSDRFVISAEHLPSDFNLEEVVTLQIEIENLLDLVNQCFRSTKRKQLALYELGFGPLPEEYRQDRRAYEKAKSDVRATLCRMRNG